MNRAALSRPLSIVCVAVLVLGPLESSLLGQPVSVSGRMAGKVIDRATQGPLAGVTVHAKRITSQDVFSSSGTDAAGRYSVPDLPAGIYAIHLTFEGEEYPIEGRFDVRAGADFLLESCFDVDRDEKTARLLPYCSSGFYAESQIVSLGSLRYFRSETHGPSDVNAPSAEILQIDHDGRRCFERGRYPRLSSDINPRGQVQVGRVYFRAAQYRDFYYVDMVDTGHGFQALLPKPAPDTGKIVYYIEAMSTSFDRFNTPEHTPYVTVDVCDGDSPGSYFTGSDPGIVVGSIAPGAPNVPPGFLPDGIASFITATGSVVGATPGASAGGSFLTSTTGLVLIVSGAAAATVIAVRASDENEASPIR